MDSLIGIRQFILIFMVFKNHKSFLQIYKCDYINFNLILTTSSSISFYLKDVNINSLPFFSPVFFIIIFKENNFLYKNKIWSSKSLFPKMRREKIGLSYFRVSTIYSSIGVWQIYVLVELYSSSLAPNIPPRLMQEAEQTQRGVPQYHVHVACIIRSLSV